MKIDEINNYIRVFNKMPKLPITLNWICADISFGRIKAVATSKSHFYIIEEGIGTLRRNPQEMCDDEFTHADISFSVEIDGKTDIAFYDIIDAKNYCEYYEIKNGKI